VKTDGVKTDGVKVDGVNSSPWRTAAALTFFFILTAGFYWQLTLSRQYTWLENPDQALQVRPWLDYAARELHAGRLPLWAPYEWGGQSLIGQVQPGLANPLNWPLYAMPLRGGHIPIETLHWYWVLIHWVAAVFAWWLCRDLGAGAIPSLAGGAIFGLTGFLGHSDTPQFLMPAVWLPVILLFFARVRRGWRPVASAGWCGAALGAAFLGGHHNLPIYTSVVMGGLWAWMLAGHWRRRKLWMAAAAFAATSFLVAAVQILPALEYGRQALRWAGAPDALQWRDRIPYSVHAEYSLGARSVPGMVLPGLSAHANPFVGSVALTLALMALWLAWGRAEVRLLAAVALGALLLALGRDTPVHRLAYALIPMVEKARYPAMAIAICQAAIAALAALGLDAWRASVPLANGVPPGPGSEPSRDQRAPRQGVPVGLRPTESDEDAIGRSCGTSDRGAFRGLTHGPGRAPQENEDARLGGVASGTPRPGPEGAPDRQGGPPAEGRTVAGCPFGPADRGSAPQCAFTAAAVASEAGHDGRRVHRAVPWWPAGLGAAILAIYGIFRPPQCAFTAAAVGSDAGHDGRRVHRAVPWWPAGFGAAILAIYGIFRLMRHPTVSEPVWLVGLAALGLAATLWWLRGAPAAVLALLVVEAMAVPAPLQRRDVTPSYLKLIESQRDIADFLRRQPGWFRFEADEDVVPYNFGDWYGLEQFGAYTASMPAAVHATLGQAGTARLFGVAYRVAREVSGAAQVEVFQSRSGLKVFRDPRIGPPVWVEYATPCGTPAQTILLERTPERTSIHATTACPGLLVVGDPWFIGWRAWVNGRRTRIQQYQGVIRAVPLEAGASFIEFQYQPGSVYWGGSLSLVGLALAVVLHLRTQ